MKVRERVGAIIVKNGRLLLVWNNKYPHIWTPGGKKEEGESDEECLRRELNEELGLTLPTEEGVETLAGFLFGLFGSVPKEKQKIDYKGYQFVVEKIIRRRIKQVRVIHKTQKS